MFHREGGEAACSKASVGVLFGGQRKLTARPELGDAELPGYGPYARTPKAISASRMRATATGNARMMSSASRRRTV